MPDVRYALWDFGDTLVDQGWMGPSPEGAPGVSAGHHAPAAADIDVRWNLGNMTTEELLAIFASELGSEPAVLMAHCLERCCDVRFYEHAWAAARARALPQAIVTVNSDGFSRFVVPNYALESTFDEIVTSW